MNQTTFTLKINGEEIAPANVEELHKRLQSIQKIKFSEVWLSQEKGAALSMLTNQDRAWLMYLRYVGDSGFVSVNPNYEGPADTVLEFHLSNGQADEYPARWTVSLEEALSALEYFFTHGEKASWIQWRDDE